MFLILSRFKPHRCGCCQLEGAATAVIVGRDANVTGEPRASMVGAAAIASSSVPIFSQLSQNSVSTQELTKNFPWANLGF
jgi:hypothetical protein